MELPSWQHPHVQAVFLGCSLPTAGLCFWDAHLAPPGLLLAARTDCGRLIPGLASSRHCGLASLHISTFLDPVFGDFFGLFFRVFLVLNNRSVSLVSPQGFHRDQGILES